MGRKAPGFGDTLGEWLIAEGLVPDGGDAGAIADVARVRAILIAAACERRAVSYSELLGALGHRFTRPKMRAVCKTLDAIDAAAPAAGEPELAVMVVRETDRLPGQGWWVGSSERYGYKGEWTGPEASRLVAQLQAQAFDYWDAERHS
jgi:hypothetical protein